MWGSQVHLLAKTVGEQGHEAVFIAGPIRCGKLEHCNEFETQNSWRYPETEMATFSITCHVHGDGQEAKYSSVDSNDDVSTQPIHTMKTRNGIKSICKFCLYLYMYLH